MSDFFELLTDFNNIMNASEPTTYPRAGALLLRSGDHQRVGFLDRGNNMGNNMKTCYLTVPSRVCLG